MRKVFPAGLLLSAVLILAGCGDDGSVPAEQSSAEDDPIAVMELSMVDSIGVELGDTNYVFGSIEAVSHTGDGDILVLDRAVCQVRQYTPAGEFVLSMGRRGSGPGEFINPLSMTRLTDGRVLVLDQQTGGFHAFSPDGEWLGVTVEMVMEPILWITPADGNRFVGTLNSFDVVDEQLIATAVVARFTADSAGADHIYWENIFPWNFRDFSLLAEESYFARTWTSDRQGNVFVAPRDGEIYEITGYDPLGEPFVTISLDLPQVEKEQEELAAESAFWTERAKNMGANLVGDIELNPYRWQVHSMGVDGDGRLWVRRGTEETPTFDVFDYDGERLFTAVLPGIDGWQGLLWEVRVDDHGILAWTLDPANGYQKLYVLELVDGDQVS